MARSPKRDLPHVVVDGDVGAAIKSFCLAFKHCGIIRELRFREDHPSRADRKREKRRIAQRRLRKAQNRATTG